MLNAVNGYYNGENVVLTENVSPKKGQRAIIIFLDDEHTSDMITAADNELDEVSEMLLTKNHEAYEELAK